MIRAINNILHFFKILEHCMLLGEFLVSPHSSSPPPLQDIGCGTHRNSIDPNQGSLWQTGVKVLKECFYSTKKITYLICKNKLYITFDLRQKNEFQPFSAKNQASQRLVDLLVQQIRSLVFGRKWMNFISQSQIKGDYNFNFSVHNKPIYCN